MPLSCLNAIVELQSIQGCHHIYNYLEEHQTRILKVGCLPLRVPRSCADTPRLVQNEKGMEPLRGKGPLLLRLSNELLRRLPKSKAEDVIFSGRILMFLSSVFALGEKSGVNLRGNYNISRVTTWEDPLPVDELVIEETAEGDKPVKGGDQPDPIVPAPPRPDFYATFWSLQTFFSNPPTLFSPPPASDVPSSSPPPRNQFQALQDALAQTLDAFAAATKKERELGGTTHHSIKPPPGEGASDEELEHYFFPKFLTSRNLLQLEVSSPIAFLSGRGSKHSS